MHKTIMYTICSIAEIIKFEKTITFQIKNVEIPPNSSLEINKINESGIELLESWLLMSHWRRPRRILSILYIKENMKGVWSLHEASILPLCPNNPPTTPGI